jgi:hypothetical protein
MNAHNDVPQGLKPSTRALRYGMAEAVPFVEGISPREHRARRTGAEPADLSTPLRSGRDDKSVGHRDSALPEKVRGTADPSAALGMTKGRATLLLKAVAGQKKFFIALGGMRAHEHSGRGDKLVSSEDLSPRPERSAVERSADSSLNLWSAMQVMTR